MFSYFGWVQVIVFSLDGQILISGSNDGILKIWNLGIGKLVCILKGWFG